MTIDTRPTHADDRPHRRTDERHLVAVEAGGEPTPRRRTIDDPAFYAFLDDRFGEEVLAATRRRETATPEQAAMTERGLRLLDELVTDLRLGRGIDPTSLELLKLAYGRHPDFRDSWHATAA